MVNIRPCKSVIILILEHTFNSGNEQSTLTCRDLLNSRANITSHYFFLYYLKYSGQQLFCTIKGGRSHGIC